MLKGFKEFVLRGNIIELAIAVVIGSAFAAVVTAFTSAIINPILARIGGVDAGGWGIQLGDKGNEATLINIGTLITAILTFLITAAVVYFVFVVPMNHITERAKSKMKAEEKPAPPSDNELLLEIRDLLQQANDRASR